MRQYAQIHDIETAVQGDTAKMEVPIQSCPDPQIDCDFQEGHKK